MKLENSIPPYTLPSNPPLAIVLGANPAAFTLMRHRRRRAPPRAWPPGSVLVADSEPPATSNRRFRKWIWNGWTKVLSPSQRAAWATWAGTVQWQNHKLHYGQYTAFQTFTWWHTLHSNEFYTTGHTFNPATATLFANPPSGSKSDVFPTTAWTMAACSPGQFTLATVAHPDVNPTGVFFQISTTPGKIGAPNTGKFSLINNGILTTDGLGN